MVVITKEIHAHAGHIVTSQQDKQGKPGKCSESIHGHSYRVIATAHGDVVPDEDPNGGMILDFGELKKAMNAVIYDEADHAMYIWDKDPMVPFLVEAYKDPHRNPDKLHIVSWMPTAENLAKHWFFLLVDYFKEHYPLIKMKQIAVFETPTSSAIFTGM
jgi:6-pyruvoyltetrahydropterin/6-carboxytetrahydropterin synthase